MHSLFNLSFLLTFLLTDAAALPTTSQNSKPRHVAPIKRISDGKLSRRYNGVGNVQGIPNGGQTNWAIPVAIGGYNGVLSIDTGSADIWVFGQGADNPSGHPIYYPAENNADPGESFDIQYLGTGTGNGGISGEVALDSVTVAGFQVPRMALGVANTLGSDFANMAADGIIGFGFQGQNSIKPDQSPTFFETSQSNLDQPIFALDLHADGSGTIELGAVDNSAYQGELMSLPIDGTTSSWIVDGVTFDFGDGFTMPMSFDTGAVTTAVDTSIASAYWAQVDGAFDAVGDGSGWEYPCGAMLPDFNLYVNGQTIALPGSVLAWTTGGPVANEGMCGGGLSGVSGTGSMGVNVFENYYIVFNQADPSIQLAPQA